MLPAPLRWLVGYLKFLGYCALHLPWLNKARSAAPWVIGGHRGRAYQDNSAAVHSYLTRHTDQPVIWITGSSDVFAELSSKGHRVLRRGSVEARKAILEAPVLIRSHGEGDLDPYLVKRVRPHGLLVHLNHCMNHLKAGQMHNPMVAKLSLKERQRKQRSLFLFDKLLASSEKERENFGLSLPGREQDIVLGGGAHLDSMFEAKGCTVENTLLYFPTFRDPDVQGRPPAQIIDELVENERLVQWLRREGFTFQICRHINDVVETKPLPPEFSWLPTEEVVGAMQRCTLFISDYSGLLCDYLIYDKPAVFFPYDLDAYLEVRHLYVDYEQFAFGELARDTEQLVHVLTSGAWRNMSAHTKRRDDLKKAFFPHPGGTYSKRTVETIQRLLTERKALELS